MVKKILTILGISLVVLFVLAITLPFVFAGKIKDLARKEMNENLRAKSGFSDVSLSFFRHFPQVSVDLINCTSPVRQILPKIPCLRPIGLMWP